MPVPSSPPSPHLTQAGRPQRNYRLPARYQDVLPESLLAVQPLPIPLNLTPAPSSVRRVVLIVRDHLVTMANKFGLWRDYPRRPSYDPDMFLSLEDLSSFHMRNSPPESPVPQPDPMFFSNKTVGKLMSWAYNGNYNKSSAEINKLVREVLLAKDFNADELIGFNALHETEKLDQALTKETDGRLYSQFTETSIIIDVPSGCKDKPPVQFSVPGLLHRSLLDAVKAAFNHLLAHQYHLSPFRVFRHSPVTNQDEQVFGEVYSSETFLQESESIQRSPTPEDDPICKRERVVAALMFASDSTHLATFGTAKAWPIYLMLGNLSKYVRACLELGAIQHLAYIPSVRLLGIKIYLY